MRCATSWVCPPSAGPSPRPGTGGRPPPRPGSGPNAQEQAGRAAVQPDLDVPPRSPEFLAAHQYSRSAPCGREPAGYAGPRCTRSPAAHRRRSESMSSTMRAVQVVGYHQNLRAAGDPRGPRAISGPLDVIVRVGGAGVAGPTSTSSRGSGKPSRGCALPYTIGHENAGWVEAVGDRGDQRQAGDKVIVHPLMTCGLCRACRSGDDVHCENSQFPGINTSGGYAEYLLTSGAQRGPDRRFRSRSMSRRWPTPG